MKIKKDNKIMKKLGVLSTVLVIVSIFLFSSIFSKSNFFQYLSVKSFQISNIISGVLSSDTNDYRVSDSKKPLVLSDKLTRSAQMKADDMARRGYFSHMGPLGESPWSWFEKVGYKYEYAGENLAVDFSESKDVSTAWFNSATHKANLLNPNFTEIGIGIAEGIYNGHKTTFVVQFFGKPEENIVVEKKLEIKQEPVKTIELKASISPVVPIATMKGIPPGEVLGTEDSSVNRENVYLKIFIIFVSIVVLCVGSYVLIKKIV